MANLTPHGIHVHSASQRLPQGQGNLPSVIWARNKNVPPRPSVLLRLLSCLSLHCGLHLVTIGAITKATAPPQAEVPERKREVGPWNPLAGFQNHLGLPL